MQAALPFGSFRAPTEGWLIIRGNRSFQDCAEVDAYDLATGTALVARRCSRGDGRPLGEPLLESGRIPLEQLREAAWMLLFARRVGERQMGTEVVELPPGIPRMLRRRQGLRGAGIPACSSSHPITLDWMWLGGDAPRTRGEPRLSGCGSVAGRHAADLLEVAEAAFSEGCIAALPPATLPTIAPRYVSAPDPDMLLELLVREAPRRRCSRRPR